MRHVTSTTPGAQQRVPDTRQDVLQRARAGKPRADLRRRAEIIREHLASPRAKDWWCAITPTSTPAELRALGVGCTAGTVGLPHPARHPPEARDMTTNTAVRQPARRRPTRPAQTQQPISADEELRALWAMTPAQRIAAMWRGQLTRRQLSKWTSRAPYEVPLLGGEFAWIAMRTPDWAEPSHPAHADRKART